MEWKILWIGPDDKAAIYLGVIISSKKMREVLAEQRCSEEDIQSALEQDSIDWFVNVAFEKVK